MNIFKTGVLLVALTMLLIWIGSAIGGQHGAMVAFIFAIIFNFGSYWFSDKIVLAMYRAKEVSKFEASELYSIIENLTSEADLPMPKICIIPGGALNAFATGRDPQHAAVCVTEGLLNSLSADELKGVLAHELSHIRNRDTLVMTIAASIAGAVMMIAYMARWAAIFGGFGRGSRDRGGNIFGLLAISILAPIAAIIIQLAISRTREYSADRSAARLAHSPLGLASALKKLNDSARYNRLPASQHTAHLFIVNPLNRRDFISNLFSTHPPINERVRRLKSIP